MSPVLNPDGHEGLGGKEGQGWTVISKCGVNVQ